ncbi:hypothetical protein A2954_04795 [Candidatus Roizmanbacteria bacterium RIFCSPLOWO2_01_FULL_37_12]|uniref:GH18 domain-containing protein n=1 Tax=Candidatus Roizmanbacteria bacterium RIFCSPLOWO2_01_FULL_37_12 TaxID=1802056 RepID=A0A1F7IG16_9BACT|nr:MAG: hypothetical protein A3D76_02595 [Candidatus Roizmanbacteria bacterium RIFCSPHIGHO2_02_FULL_37_9b]OGK42297.1 MAG: hypothetical protein A2954_04795 [Candidatus Roizmanbacteria bacterium RIFCSPLOWO2_01_FULL_37_12]
MKKIALILLLLFGGCLGYYLGRVHKKQSKAPELQEIKQRSKKVQGVKADIISKSVFIPYWSLDSENIDLSRYDYVIYFGIVPNYQGIDKKDSGFYGIPTFTKLAVGKKKFITLRMIDEEINNFILKNKDAQEKVILETLKILEQYQLDGIVLDLEISGLYNNELTAQINAFAQLFYSEAQNNYRKFYLTIYGDNLYRGRPFDLSELSKNSDGIMVMAYDFHKSRGEPGPNFPYESGAKYQYNFKNMISDFLKYIPKNKLTVIFGMFGYDWLVDEKKRPIRQAEALSYNEIKKKFLDKCEFKNCVVKRDEISMETEVNYLISSNTPDEQQIYRIDYHIVWFEDEESVKIKTDYLREQGISSISYWAFGYF